MPATKMEGPRDLAFLLSEGNGKISRDVVTVLAGSGVVEAGTVLGEITASKKFMPSPAATVTGKEGAETAKAILAYKVDATAADAEAVVVKRLAEAKAPMLIFDASVNDATKKAVKLSQLAAATIIAR